VQSGHLEIALHRQRRHVERVATEEDLQRDGLLSGLRFFQGMGGWLTRPSTDMPDTSFRLGGSPRRGADHPTAHEQTAQKSSRAGLEQGPRSHLLVLGHQDRRHDTGRDLPFDVDPFARMMLLAGTDELGYLVGSAIFAVIFVALV